MLTISGSPVSLVIGRYSPECAHPDVEFIQLQCDKRQQMRCRLAGLGSVAPQNHPCFIALPLWLIRLSWSEGLFSLLTRGFMWPPIHQCEIAMAKWQIIFRKPREGGWGRFSAGN